MADSSWDNGGHGVPLKPGLPLWAKVAMGCGIAFLVALVTCVGGVAYVVNKAKKDPEGFKQRAMSAVADRLRPDWEDFRAVVEQLRTPEGCQALYRANPGLSKTWPTESEFLDASSRWHKEILPAPAELTFDLMEHGGLQINHTFGSQVKVGWSPKGGRSVYVTFERTRKAGDRGPRLVAELDVR
ncbi:hypothetical protein [Geothrix sp. SG200]|uniref:hypothetical protein n=1 Tax=Geothrix sp. SG200 TaxID=2922865 RepID=UPI001FACA443|nr:hypothetical protein [Geothrix sp. SG200]